MRVEPESQDNIRQDPRYSRGMVHLQAGFFDQAIACFEEVVRDYPQSELAQHALEEARFKASLEAQSRIRPKRWIIPWRPILVRGLIVLATAFLAVMGVRLIQGPVAVALEEMRIQGQLATLAEEGNDLFEAGKLDEAEERYSRLLTATPEHQLAQERMVQITEERELAALYQQAVAHQEAGEDEEALALFTQLQLRRPRYLDSSIRIDEILQHQDQDALFARAEEAFAAGDSLEALGLYEDLRRQYANYERDTIDDRLFTLYMQLGQGLIEQDPPVPEAIPEALDYFTLALSLQPRSSEAAQEQQLVRLYLDGQARYQAEQWSGAIAQLRTIVDQRPDYLRGTAADMLYEAYIRTGDQHRDEEDCGLAYQRYGQAASLPVADTTVAEARQLAVAYCVPPTNTPTVTPTPTSTLTPTPPPTPTPWTPPTPIPPPPTATPTPTPYNLAMLRNRIIFVLDREGTEELWAMDPDGGNRLYLGPFGQYQGQYNAIREAERLSPDGNYRLFVKQAGGSPQIFIYQPPHPQYGPLPDRQISFLTGLSYDPVWSPDGGRVAFVSTDNGSDDIWLVQADGKGARWLVNNDWEWDKHPTWSPDSQRIVFWSNRHGIKQIFIMNADGSQQRPLSNSDWDEYDPIWIK